MSDQINKKAPLTIQSVRDAIANEHKIILDENDPILITVTMHRAALDEYEQLLFEHRELFSKDMSVHISAFTSEVRKSTQTLLSKSVKNSIDNCLSTITAHQAQMSSFLSSMKMFAIFSTIILSLAIATALTIVIRS